MNKKIILTLSIIAAGVVASLMIWRKAETKLTAQETLASQQADQLAQLNAEHQRLSNLVSDAKAPHAENNAAELQRLRTQAAALRQQTNHPVKSSNQRSRPDSSRAPAAEEAHPPEYYEQFNRMAGAKGRDARNLATASTMYASDHNGQFPANVEQLASYLADANFALSGTNQFEIVYQGSQNKLEGLPAGSIALVRDRHTWTTPDGKRLARVYGMVGGVGQTITSDDNFRAWEAEHVIPTPKAAAATP